MNNQVRKQSEIISEFREQARLQPLRVGTKYEKLTYTTKTLVPD